MKTLIFGLVMISSTLLFGQDKIETTNNEFTLHLIGHGTLYIEYNDQIIHIDPWSRLANYDSLPDADYILVTHDHGDHLDTKAIEAIQKDNTKIIAAKGCEGGLDSFTNLSIFANGETMNTPWGEIKAVPAYNIKHVRDSGKPYHPKGVGNGYVLNLDGTTVYIAGDTENIPEMGKLKGTDIAFLPMNLPYTMTPEMVADAAKMIEPRILYPYHYGNTDTGILKELLKDSQIDVRIREMQ